MTELSVLLNQTEDLLKKTPYDSKVISLTPCNIGGNNRTYRLETKDGLFALKQYCRQVDDARDRLASEYAFLSYATRIVPEMTPHIYAKDKVKGLALYEFLEGQPFRAGEIGHNEVMKAAAFFSALNQPEVLNQASDIPKASEACFSLADHITLLDKRLNGLREASAKTEEDRLAKGVIQALNTQWENIVKRATHLAGQYGISLTKALDPEDRCISPSDFGFHNALSMPDGSIRFIDFEYAGWDDPAKMIGDFFAQLAVPVPADYYAEFTETVLQPFPSYPALIQRAEILRPIYQVKWCCIALNIFQPVHLARRKFANPQLNEVELKRNQLSKVKTLLQALEVPNYA